jgi:hypothetical protein
VSEEWRSARCPLPVLRYVEDPAGSHGESLEIQNCGEPLCIVATGTGDVWDLDGRLLGCDDNVAQWRVECHQGHVLLIPDIEDRSIRWEDCGDEWLPSVLSITWSAEASTLRVKP